MASVWILPMAVVLGLVSLLVAGWQASAAVVLLVVVTVAALFAGVPGVIVKDDPANNVYPLPTDGAGVDEVFVGRIREDASLPSGKGGTIEAPFTK